MSKIRRIKSKKEKLLFKIDIIFIILCLILTNVKMVSSGGTTFIDGIIQNVQLLIKLNANLPLILITTIGLLWMMVMNVIIHCFWIIAFYIAYRTARKKALKKNSQYQVIDNIDYYRETFNNITPAEISLITDLEIETKKDIAASILDLYQRGIVEFTEDTIVVKNKDNLSACDSILVNMIEEKNFGITNIKKWESACTEQALTNNYIKFRNANEKGPRLYKAKLFMALAFAVLISSIVSCITYLASDDGKEFMNQLENLGIYVEERIPEADNMSDLEVLEKLPELDGIYKETLENAKVFLGLVIILTLSFIILIICPVYMLVRKIFYHSVENANKYERTKTGNILVEQIAGIKNYIHDFSLLSEKDKEYVKVWENFLIYAIVLEENESIVNEIFNYKNMDSGLLTSMNKFVTSNVNV